MGQMLVDIAFDAFEVLLLLHFANFFSGSQSSYSVM